MRLLRVALGALALGLATSAHAVTIDFESGNTPPDPPPGFIKTWSTLRTGEYVFTCVQTGGGAFSAFTANTRGTNVQIGELFASNDSVFIGRNNGNQAIFMSRADFPAPFSLISFQASKIQNTGFDASTLRVAGALAGGGVLEVDFLLDGIADGNGGLEDFQTFTLPAPFSNVLAVSFDGFGRAGGGSFLLDNLVVVAIPEPATALLLGVGLMVVAARSRSGRNIRET